MLIENIKSERIMSIFYLFAIVILIAALVFTIYSRRDKEINDSYYKQPYVTLAVSLMLLGNCLKNFLKYIDSGSDIIIYFYIEGIIAFTVLTVYELVRVFIKKNLKSAKLIYGIIIGAEVIKILIIFLLELIS